MSFIHTTHTHVCYEWVNLDAFYDSGKRAATEIIGRLKLVFRNLSTPHGKLHVVLDFDRNKGKQKMGSRTVQ